MKLNFEDIIDKHKDKPCVIALHGPSIDEHIESIEKLQKEDKVIRFSVNEWYDHFSVKPDYWVVSNGEFTIAGSLLRTPIWEQRNYPHDVFNEYQIPLLYNVTADLTPGTLINQRLTCDYLPYDTRHFQKHSCLQILKNFRDYYIENENFEFDFYGNNSQMWKRPDVSGFPDWIKHLHGNVGSGWDVKGKCCPTGLSSTLQEKLMEFTGHEQHAGPGQTVGLFCIMFAILMGCNPIYVGGLDLDCTLGYGKNANPKATFNQGHIGHWKKIYRKFLIDDMRIINESAKLMGIDIINLNKDSWHNEFTKDKFNF
jgi:hypothetical protein|tara:strand:- start:313 stop:1248 length:936 start_codon:yes stop_codon:yes gene_type:complete